MLCERTTGQSTNCMGKSAPIGQGTGVLEKETPTPQSGVLRVPPTGGTPCAGIAQYGEWLVVMRMTQDAWAIKIFTRVRDAERFYRHLAPYSDVYLTYIVKQNV